MGNSIQYIPLNALLLGEFHPHQETSKDVLDNLTNSIKIQGIINPLIVRPKNNKYEIILGNRRYKAACILNLEKIPALIINIDDKQALELIISDNIHRKELTSKEEGKLYNQALSYPNTSPEQLSIDLGIPLNRINSKLNLIKKEKQPLPQFSTNQNELDNYTNKNNSVNNDIINLSELNQKEKERDVSNMNNNQYMNNNLNQLDNNLTNNISNNTQTIQPNQNTNTTPEPSFGGRFFPSLEDEPTNMNLNTNIDLTTPNFNPNINLNNPQQEPLIDLTDLSNDNQNNQIPTATSINIPTSNNLSNDLNYSSAQSLNNNIDNTPSQPNQYINNIQPPQPMNEINNTQVSEYNNNLNQLDNNYLNNNQQYNQEPNFNPTDINIPNLNTPNQEINNQYNQLPPTPSIPDLSYLNNNISEQISQELQNQNIPQSSSIINPIDINQSESTKDVLPVVNMIKNLAVSIETLGYKLNINEENNSSSYKITIEVEK